MTEPDKQRFKVFPVPPEMAEFCREVAHELAVDLGESAEAWRGAAVMAYFIKCAVSAEASALIESGVPVEPGELAMHLLLTTALLEQFPTWPKEAGGEPLILDDNPPEDIAHFREVQP